MWKSPIPAEASVKSGNEDLLGFDVHVAKMVRAINFVKPPVTIGVVGPWGSGKTSFMELVQEELDKSPTCLTIWFEAWKYSSTGELLPALLHQMHLASEKISPVGAKKLAEATRIALTIVADLGIRVVTGAAGASTGLEEIKGVVDSASKRVEDEFLKSIRSVDRLHDAFAESIKEIRKSLQEKTQSKQEEIKLCVFIDDLDRCSPDQALNLVEQMQLHLGSEGVIYVLGLSTDAIETALAARYGSDSDLVDEYLQKLIHLQFPVPKSSGKLERIGQSLAEIMYGSEQADIKEFVTGLCEGFKAADENNPRMLKMLVKQMAFYWSDVHCDPKKTSFRTAGYIVAGQAIWPDLTAFLAEHRIHGNHFTQWLESNNRMKTAGERSIADSSVKKFEAYELAGTWFLNMVSSGSLNWTDVHPGFKQIVDLVKSIN